MLPSKDVRKQLGGDGPIDHAYTLLYIGIAEQRHMTNLLKKTLLVFLSVCMLGSCSYRQAKDAKGKNELQYATFLKMNDLDDGTSITVMDPWQQGKVLQQWLLVKADSKEKAHGALRPLRRVVQLLEYLHLQDRIVGVCDLQYILIPDIQRRAKAGKIADCGNSMSPDVEKIIALHPDAIIISPYEGNTAITQLSRLGIPIIQAADYMETSALGRAEWMRYYGRLFDCGARADSLFHVVDSTYQSLKRYAASLPLGKSIITERMTGNVWYMPGGKSTIAALIRDAHARYAFADDQHSGSLPLSLEQVIAKAGQSDVWALKYNGPQPLTKQTLLLECKGYSVLKAMKTGQIYVCDCSVVPYFEEVSWRPDWQLREFIQLLHPQAKLGKLRYYRKENN